MRVLAVSSYGVLGGAELHLATFAEHRPGDVELEVLVLEAGPLAQRLTALGVPTRVAPGSAGRPTARDLARFGRSFYALLRRSRPDVVWAKGQKAALLAAPACRAAGVPVVWHKVDFSWERELALPLALACDGVIGVSHAVLEALGPLRERRALGVAGVPIRLPLEAEARPDPARPVIGAVARLLPYKGLHHIVEAAAALRPEFPELRVVFVGGAVREYPDYRARLLQLADRHDLGDRLELHGFVDDPLPLLERFSVFVSATYRDEEGFGLEGLPGSVLEAGWTGVPVVATDAGGTAEAIQDGRSGTLVAGAEELAPAIAAYLRDPALAARAGAAGRAFVRAGFAPDVAAERLFGMLRSVVRRPRAARRPERLVRRRP